MAKKEIQFSLVYRDMWQSSGRYVPRRDQLAKVAPVIIDMGCFDRVETNGGASEQVNLLYGENPNLAVRTFCKPFNEAGIKTHMLDRGLNALRMNPVPADVRQLMYKVKHAQGTNITRIFCGLNDPRNIIPSIKWAKAAGMTAQATMCITYSKVHTREYYINLAEQLIEAGAEEICLKDMAGVGRPAMLGDIVRAIKEKHPHIIIQYHGHTGPGFSVASMLEVAKAGGDVLDVAMEPLSWGKVHPDVITIQAMLRDAGFLVKDINMKAYMEARSLTQSFIDDFLGYWIDPKNALMTSLLVGCGLPGGMMGSLMADLKGMHAAINANLKKKGEPELSEDELLVQLFDEVQRIWPMLGTPCLVTPFSQYVKNAALMNLFSRSMGEKDFTRMDPAMWGMILGKSGKLPGELAPEIVELAKERSISRRGRNSVGIADKTTKSSLNSPCTRNNTVSTNPVLQKSSSTRICWNVWKRQRRADSKLRLSQQPTNVLFCTRTASRLRRPKPVQCFGNWTTMRTAMLLRSASFSVREISFATYRHSMALSRSQHRSTAVL